MLAVIKTGGKQYKVRKGDILKIEKLNQKEGSEITFNHVLLMGDKIGTPKVAGAKVKAQVLGEGRDKKIRVVKYKPKTRYYKVKGHRQPFTQVKITEIV